jgi:broad specificity phosphatase PhoE
MSDSPLSPQGIQVASAAHAELGPEYSDAAVALFLERADQRIVVYVADADWAGRYRGGQASVRTGPRVGQG